MKIKNLKNKLKSTIIVLVLGISLAGGITFAAWTGTSWITTGATIDATKIKDNFDYLYDQLWQKDGSNVYYNSGNVGIGTASPSNKLEVAGKIEADQYCDRGGANCTTAAQMGGIGTVRIASASATAPNGVARSVSCNSNEQMTGGGGRCTSSRSSALNDSYPSGNGWYARCNTAYYSQTITVTVYAVCMAK